MKMPSLDAILHFASNCYQLSQLNHMKKYRVVICGLY